MTAESRAERLKRRRLHEDANLFGRLQAAAAGSRAQGQKCLRLGGSLSILEWRVLWDLHEAGPLTIRDIATIQRTDHSLISRALPQMRDKGLVTLARGETDKRQTLVALTRVGKAAYAKAAPVMKQRRERLRAAFSAEEMARFLEFIDRFEAYLSANPGMVTKLPETVT